MGNTYTADALISLLKKQAGQLCLSVVIPFGRQDSEEVRKGKISQMTAQAVQYLRQQHNPVMQSAGIVREGILQEAHYDRHCSGIGIFVSKEVREVFCFVFPVKEKFVLADRFDLCDLLFHAQYEQGGYILQLTRKGVSLFFAGLHETTEIRDDHFPWDYLDDYEYARPAHASSHKGHAVTQQFEQDKSHLQQVRYTHFLQDADQHLAKYLGQSVPFIITGEAKLLNAFEKHTAFLQNLAGIFPGNFSKLPLTELHQTTRHLFHQHIDRRISFSIRQLVEKAGSGLAAEGLSECWRAANEGKGLLLLVEKDYKAIGFLTAGNENRLLLTPPRIKHRILTNAVNDLVYTVLEKKGQVLIVGHDLLRDHQRIGLIKRYV